MNNNRIEILTRIIQKSDQLMDAVIMITTKIQDAKPGLYMQQGETSMTSPFNAVSGINDLKDYRSILAGQLKESSERNSKEYRYNFMPA